MKKEEKEKWAGILSKYLVVTEKHETRFSDISIYLTEIAERLFNRRFSHNIRNLDVVRVIRKAGGCRKRVTSEMNRWNVSFVCEPWPTVLFPAKLSVGDLKQSYLKRKRDPIVDQQAHDLFLLLTKENNHD